MATKPKLINEQISGREAVCMPYTQSKRVKRICSLYKSIQSRRNAAQTIIIIRHQVCAKKYCLNVYLGRLNMMEKSQLK